MYALTVHSSSSSDAPSSCRIVRQRRRHDERVEADHERRRARRAPGPSVACALRSCRFVAFARRDTAAGENRTGPFSIGRGVLTSDVDRRGREQATSAPSRRWSSRYRRELQLHCYRMLGSLQDAEDLVQETLLAAWRGLGGFEERASLRAWLYRIATNRCLNALRDARAPPARRCRADGRAAEPTRHVEPIWLEPYPDALLTGSRPRARPRGALRAARGDRARVRRRPPAPARRASARRSCCATCSASAPPRSPRCSTSREASVKGALQRARATLDDARCRDRERAPLPDSPAERELVARFADAFERGDIDGVVALLTDDALLTMPPAAARVPGPRGDRGLPRYRAERRGAPLRLCPTRANGQPAFGCYLPDAPAGVAHPHGLMVLTLRARDLGASPGSRTPACSGISGCRGRCPRSHPARVNRRNHLEWVMHEAMA